MQGIRFSYHLFSSYRFFWNTGLRFLCLAFPLLYSLFYTAFFSTAFLVDLAFQPFFIGFASLTNEEYF